MISAVDDAPSTTRFAVPNRVLSWWWSMFTMCASSRRRKLTGMRSTLPQSRKTIVRSSASAGSVWLAPSSGSQRYS